jgi:hypothetical protein
MEELKQNSAIVLLHDMVEYMCYSLVKKHLMVIVGSFSHKKSEENIPITC